MKQMQIKTTAFILRHAECPPATAEIYLGTRRTVVPVTIIIAARHGDGNMDILSFSNHAMFISLSRTQPPVPVIAP